jgi:hypothetical protein
LETFDPIGRWRFQYPKPNGQAKPAAKIDPSGEFPSGETYADFSGFKSVLAATREDLFVRHLIRQFLMYATGRRMELADDFLIDEIRETVKRDGLGLQTLLETCLMSEIFRSR